MQKDGIITCIPKQNKDRQLLKNWRPISLLNCSYKVASACLANRLKKVLPYYILVLARIKQVLSQAVILAKIFVLFTIHYITPKKVSVHGLLLLIDFEKAFDSVS